MGANETDREKIRDGVCFTCRVPIPESFLLSGRIVASHVGEYAGQQFRRETMNGARLIQESTDPR